MYSALIAALTAINLQPYYKVTVEHHLMLSMRITFLRPKNNNDVSDNIGKIIRVGRSDF